MGVISIDCVTTILLRKLLQFCSVETASVCHSVICPKQWKDAADMLVSLDESHFTRAHFGKLDASWFSLGPAACLEPFPTSLSPDANMTLGAKYPDLVISDPDYHAGRPVYNGLRTHSVTNFSPHIFFEVSVVPVVSSEQNQDAEMSESFRLDHIPEQFMVDWKRYRLRGAIGFNISIKSRPGPHSLTRLGHYKTYCLFGENWVCFDDLRDKPTYVSSTCSANAVLFLFNVIDC